MLLRKEFEMTEKQIYQVEVDEYGTIRWLQNGKLHRLNGPAVEYASGKKYWWINDKQYCTEEEYNKKIQELNKSSCEGKVVEIDGKKYKLVEVSKVTTSNRVPLGPGGA